MDGGGAQPTEVTVEVDVTDQGVGNRERGCPDLEKDLCGGGPGSLSVWVGDVGDDTVQWEGFGRILPQGGPQADGTATADGERQEVGISPAGGGSGGGGVTGGGDLRLPPTEHSQTVHCDQAHY